jgi:hypothetical protein
MHSTCDARLLSLALIQEVLFGFLNGSHVATVFLEQLLVFSMYSESTLRIDFFDHFNKLFLDHVPEA